MENTPSTSSYRPHDPGHNYYVPGIYLITLVVRNRHDNHSMFGTLNDDLKHPQMMLNEVGNAVMDCWRMIPEYQKVHHRKVIVHTAVCMPDHFHGVIEVQAPMDVSLGEVIRGFKAGCTMAWHDIMRPSMVADGDSQPYLDVREMLKRMSKKQRAAYYAAHPEAQQPLWDDNYDDTICLSDTATGSYCLRHFNAMIQYVDDNVRRAIIRRIHPEFMQRCLHVRIDGVDYAAFGNLFLLRWARKVQVFCHRLARRNMLTDSEWSLATASRDAILRFEDHAKAHKLGRFDRVWYLSSNPDTVTAVDYTHTAAFRQEADAWVRQVLAGATVVVTPGISPGERQMKDMCIKSSYPLIHLQKEPIGPYWKPEKARFNACANGSLLILAPWHPGEIGEVNGVPSHTDYSMFHNMNRLAEQICMFDGEASVVSFG